MRSRGEFLSARPACHGVATSSSPFQWYAGGDEDIAAPDEVIIRRVGARGLLRRGPASLPRRLQHEGSDDVRRLGGRTQLENGSWTIHRFQGFHRWTGRRGLTTTLFPDHPWGETTASLNRLPIRGIAVICGSNRRFQGESGHPVRNQSPSSDRGLLASGGSGASCAFPSRSRKLRRLLNHRTDDPRTLPSCPPR